MSSTKTSHITLTQTSKEISMSTFTPQDFINFMTSFLSVHNLKLEDQCPQATTYRKTDEYFMADDNSIHFHTPIIDEWALDIRKMLSERDYCDGFFCWVLLENDFPMNTFKVLLVNYDKLENKLTSYLSDKDLDNFQAVDLDSEFPELNIDYSEPLAIH